MTPQFVTYYTPFYREAYDDLFRSLFDLGLQDDLYAEQIDERSWRDATAYKPRFLARMLDETDRPVVWLDADCMVLRTPSLFLDGSLDSYDIAAHVRRHELLSGTVWLANNDTTKAIVSEWGDLAERDKNTWEQRHLRGVLERKRCRELYDGFYNLPASYCKIFDIMRDVEDPVIEHYQRSRMKRRAER